MKKQRIKEILSIFFDAGKNNTPDYRFEEMFKYYWTEIKEMET